MTKDLVELYIKDHEFAWTPATKRSERYRLLALIDSIDGNPTKLWRAIEGKKPYTKVTIWVRVAKFWQWLIEANHVENKEPVNPYSLFRRKNARLFKNAYQKKMAPYSFEEIKQRISQISDEAIRQKALDLLLSGLRFEESTTYSNGQVVGKGGKIREVFGKVSQKTEKNGPSFKGSYKTFWRRLNEVGLKPHDLRKAYGSELARSGLNAYDLCRVMGWEKIQTATSYIAVSSDAQLKSFIRKTVR
jgi:site-specific recombinase XerD